ncbi:MAG: hypothetical protein Q7S23_01785 [bacterium]|nr:hypothetical protein [bacterium]
MAVIFSRVRSRFPAVAGYWPTLVAIVGYLALAALYLRSADWDPTWFVHFKSDHRITQHYGGAAAGLWVRSNDVHDGISYYAIARDPFNLPLLREILNAPITRYRRIVYPVLVHALSFGQPGLVAPLLLLVNLLATIASGVLLQRLLAQWGRAPGWALAYYVHPGLVFSFLYDLPTALAILCMLLGLWWYQRGRHWQAALSISLAVLTWEVIAAPLAIGIVAAALVVQPLRLPRSRIWVLALPLAVAAVWQVALHQLFPGHLTAYEVAGNFTYPGVGWWQSFHYVAGMPFSLKVLFQASFLTLTALGCLLALTRLLKRVDLMSVLATAQASLLLVLNAGSNLLWPSELMRKSLGLWLFLFLGSVSADGRLLRWWVIGMAVVAILQFAWLPSLAVVP